MDGPRRERRQHRKAAALDGGGSAAAAAARAAYGDVFGGPPRFAAPFAGAPEDYAEVFGGVAMSCSIPFLDLPPVAAAGGGDGAGDYGEIFGQFDFGDFAVPYEELFAEAESRRATEEIGSSSGSSRSPIKKESSQLDAELSILSQHYANVDHDQHIEEDQFSPIPFPSDGQQHFSMPYDKTTLGRPDDLLEMTTLAVEPSSDYVVDSCNSLHDTATNHVSRMDNGTMACEEKGKRCFPASSSASMRSSESDSVVDQKQHIPTCPPISENFRADENHQNSHSPSASSDEAPDYPFLRVSDVNLHTQLKMLNKQESETRGEIHHINHRCIPASACASLNSNMPQAERKAGAPSFDSEVNPSSAAAAAMKEAMEFAEARLKAAKELMERKGDSFKLRKRHSLHRSTKSTEIKEIKAPEEACAFEEKLSVKKPVIEETISEGITLLDKHRKVSAVKLAHFDDSENGLLPLEKPQQMQDGTGQGSSKLEKLGNWRSDDDFYELISHDQKCKTNTTTGKEGNGERTNPITKLSKDQKGKTGVTDGDLDLERYEKLWEDNDSREVGVKHVNLREDGIASMERGNEASIILEAPILAENVAHQEVHDSHFEKHMKAGNSQEIHDNGEGVEMPCMSKIPQKSDFLESSSFSEASSTANHANDVRDLGIASSEESTVAGTSWEDKNNEEGHGIPCDGETQCTSGGSKKLLESLEVSNIDDTWPSQVKKVDLEEPEESYESQALLKESCIADVEAETCEKDKFGFGGEACLQNENKKVSEEPYKALIYEEVKNFGTEEKGSACEESEETVVNQDAECPEKENDITLQNSNLHEESDVLNVFEVASKLIERKCGILEKDPDRLQELQGSQEPGELKNRMEERTEQLASASKEKEASLENNEKTATQEISDHGRQDQKEPKTGTNKGPRDVYADVNVTTHEEGNALHSGDVVIDAADDCAMRMSINSKDVPASTPEICTRIQHFPQNAESTSAEASSKTSSGLGKAEEVSKKVERELLKERSTTFEEVKSRANKMEEKEDREMISNAEIKNQQSHHLERSCTPIIVETSGKDTPSLQMSRQKGNKIKTEREIEKEKEASRRLEEKERERKLEKEREQAKERERRRLEEKEREREREKDRLAVERATREAHERAFAEAREKAERIALERITAARQRASAEAREKEEKASAEAAAERASREARIKAERVAVERATAEARERAIEKAKAEKVSAEARERIERYRSSFRDSSKMQDIRQETQFQRPTSSNFGRNTDSVVEVESALRHKARLERHQRTAERVTKALAEKNLRDMLTQREQAERHRLAEFLDPEVKRWSNGKEGNLRALLSTLQYILGADSGWQPVPLTDLITAAAVKKAYRRATLCVHPDKLQQRGATIRQKYICEKVFDLLKEAWNKFNSEER